MKRSLVALCTAAALMLGGSASAQVGVGGSGAVRAAKKGDFYTFPYAGDNSGLQQAINYAGPGGTVNVGACRIGLTSTLTIPNGLRFIGMGDSTVFYAAANDTLFNVWGSNAVLQNFRISGQKAYRGSGSQGIIVTGQRVTISGVSIDSTYDAAIHVHMGADGAIIEKCRIRDPGGSSSTDGNGIIIHDADDARVLNNTISGTKKWGVWLQTTALRAQVTGNTILACGDDCIHQDVGANNALIAGNTIRGSVQDGIEQDGDSTTVSNNLITNCQAFGLWAQNGGSGSSYWGNWIGENGDYNIGLESSGGTTISGWAIFSNFLQHPHGQDIELQATGSGSVLRDVQITGNYAIKSDVNIAGSGPPHPNFKLVANIAGLIDRVSYTSNVSKDSRRDGLWADAQTSGAITGLAITDNHFIGNAYWGIRTTGGGAGSTAFIANNYYSNNGSGQDSLTTTNWTYEGLATAGRLKLHATSGLVEDSLRVGIAGGPNGTLKTVGDIFPGQDLMLFNKNSIQWTDNGGVYQRYIVVDSVNTLTLRPKTGTGVDVYKTSGFLGTRFIDTGGIWLPANSDVWLGTRFLQDDGSARRIIGRYGQLAFRDSSNANDNMTLSNAGDLDLSRSTPSLKLGAQTALKRTGSDLEIRPLGSGQKVIFRDWANSNDNAYMTDAGTFEVLRGTALLDKTTIVGDSLRVGKNVQFGMTSFSSLLSNGKGTMVYCDDCQQTNPCASGGSGAFAQRIGSAWNCNGGSGGGGTADPLTLNKIIVMDTLRVMGIFNTARQSGYPQAHTFGQSNGSAVGDTLTVNLNGTSDGGTRGPKLMYQRGGSPWGVLQGYGGGMELRGVSGNNLVIGQLGTTTANARWYFSDGALAIGTTQSLSHKLDVNGAASLLDTLRVGGPLDVNNTMTGFIGNTITASGTITIGVGNIFLVSGTTTTTAVTAAPPAGTRITLWTDSAWTLTDGGVFKLNGDFVGDATGDRDSITLISDGSNLYEEGRSIN